MLWNLITGKLHITRKIYTVLEWQYPADIANEKVLRQRHLVHEQIRKSKIRLRHFVPKPVNYNIDLNKNNKSPLPANCIVNSSDPYKEYDDVVMSDGSDVDMTEYY